MVAQSALREINLPLDSLGASLFDASEDCITVVGLDGSVLAMNTGGMVLSEIDDFSIWRGGPWSALWPDQHRALIEATVAEVVSQGKSRFVADCPTTSGAVKWWEVIVCPVFDEPEHPARLVAIARDITDRVRIGAEKALLARELAHRIRNMFAVVNGVVSLSARSAAPEVRPFADALRERLTGLWRAVSYVSPPALADAGATINHTLLGLLRVLLEPYGDMSGLSRRVTIGGEDTPIGDSATTSVALFANELATNSMKYGALSEPNGCVEVISRLTPEGIKLVWLERLGSLNARDQPPLCDGFGSVLLDKAVLQLGGVVERTWLKDGLRVSIDLSVARLAR